MDVITYYLIGVLTGATAATFFIGKELYKYYVKYTIQKKHLNRAIKLNDKLKRIAAADNGSLKPN